VTARCALESCSIMVDLKVSYPSLKCGQLKEISI